MNLRLGRTRSSEVFPSLDAGLAWPSCRPENEHFSSQSLQPDAIEPCKTRSRGKGEDPPLRLHGPPLCIAVRPPGMLPPSPFKPIPAQAPCRQSPVAALGFGGSLGFLLAGWDVAAPPRQPGSAMARGPGVEDGCLWRSSRACPRWDFAASVQAALSESPVSRESSQCGWRATPTAWRATCTAWHATPMACMLLARRAAPGVILVSSCSHQSLRLEVFWAGGHIIISCFGLCLYSA